MSFDRDADLAATQARRMDRMALLLRARDALGRHGSVNGQPPHIDYRLVDAMVPLLEAAAAQEMDGFFSAEQVHDLARAVIEVCDAAR